MHAWIRTLTERKLGAAIFTHRTNAATGRVNLQQGDNLQGRSKQQINSRALKFFRGKARIEGAGRTKGKNTNQVRPADEHERAGKPKTSERTFVPFCFFDLQ
jgi:hypothetical protein